MVLIRKTLPGHVYHAIEYGSSLFVIPGFGGRNEWRYYFGVNLAFDTVQNFICQLEKLVRIRRTFFLMKPVETRREVVKNV